MEYDAQSLGGEQCVKREWYSKAKKLYVVLILKHSMPSEACEE